MRVIPASRAAWTVATAWSSSGRRSMDRGMAPRPIALTVTSPRRRYLHVVLPGTHPLAGRPIVSLAELADEPWVLGCLKTEAYLRRYAEHAGFSPDVRGSTTDYFFARSLVAAGVGLSLIPTVALTPALPGVRAVPLDAPTPARHIGAAVLRRPCRPEVSTLIEALRQDAEAAAGPV
ncbi:hypothetical protein G3I18_07140, partial [Actinospica acidiphila]|nr:hypothetical protein [Actinospica acidiphila]